MNTNCRQKDFFWGAFVGGTLATLSVLMFTTKKGKQLQRQISDACEGAKETIKDAFFQAKDEVKEMAEEAVDSAEQLGKKALHKIKSDTHLK